MELRKTEKFDSAPAREYLAPSAHHEGQVSSKRALGLFMVHNKHCSCASRDQRSNQISSCRDLNPITCRGQGKEFFFPEELRDWRNSQQGGLALP